MKKLWTLLFLLLSLACVFVACDENDTPNGDGTPPPEHTHTWSEWSVTTPATCQAKGVETRSCACGEDETRDVAINPEAHSFGDWGVTTPATCQTKGTETRSCACGKDETRDVAINPEAHSFGDWSVTTPATCQTKGLETRTCACGEVETRDVNKNADNHVDWSDWSVTTPATCQTKGVETRSCACGEDDTREIAIDLSAHTEVTDAAVAPTDTTDGLTEGKHCSECGEVLIKQEVVPALLQGTAIKSQQLEVNGETITTSLSNTTETFSFLNDLTVANGASYIVARDIGCEQTIASKTVTLEIGNNTYYVLVTNGNAQKLYTVTVRRRPMYTVTFNTNGGTAVGRQFVEEGKLAAEQTTTRAGYTFTGWSHDFTTPITRDTSISASWTANTDTPYKVEYYLKNIDDDGYTRLDSETENLTGTTGTRVTAEQKTFEHFTLNTYMGTLSGNVNGNGTLVLKVYYTRNSYTVSGTVNNDMAGSITAQNGTYRYDKELTFTATTNAGYTFLGWFEGETKVCDTLTFTFRVDHDATYTAKWSINTDTPYKVEYYLQNIDNDLYALHETENLTGKTDTQITIDPKTIPHCTFVPSLSTLSGNLNGNGSLVLRVYYTRNVYTLSNANTSYGSITNVGSHRYGALVTATATAHIGCEFLGWYSGNTRITTNTTYTFTVEKNVEARFGIKTEMSNFDFTSTATTCTITGLKDKTITEIVVPDYVTGIGDSAFAGCSGLTSIALPFVGASLKGTSNTHFGYIFGARSYSYNDDYVPASLKTVVITGGTSIGDDAFCNCDGLTSITIPSSVKSIGSYAFCNCDGLTSITIGNGVTSIGSSAFSDCSSLTAVYITDLAAWCNISFGNSSANPLYYAKNLYLNGEEISGDIIIPEGVTSIPNCAFYYCDQMTSITIPSSVTSIGSSAFYNCSGLKTVTFAEGSKLTSIGNYAFEGCSSLTSITIPSSVKSIGSYAFCNCDGLTSITIGNGVTSIDYSAFGACSSLTAVYITDLAAWCNISFDNSYANPLYYAKNLYLNGEEISGDIIIPEGVTSIPNCAFYYCDQMTSITIPSSVTSIGSSAFYNCSGLKTVTFAEGSKLTSIGYEAFYNCSGLKTVTFAEGSKLTSIGNYAFYGCNGIIETESGISYVDKWVIDCGTSVTSVTLRANTVGIGDGAFDYCSKLTSITIPDSVTSIGSYAFYNCSGLKTVTFAEGSKLTSIGWLAFYGCSGIIQKENGVSYVDKWVIDCDTSVTSVTLRANTVGIGDGAFEWCSSLTSITIPSSVTYIGSYAFIYCGRLTSINYRGTEEQWNAISTGNNWNYETGNYTITYNYTGE